MPAVGRVTILAAWSGVGGAVLLGAMLLTNPTAVGPVGVTVWFVGLLTVVGALLSLVFYAIKSYFGLHQSRQQRLRYATRQGALVSGWLCGLLSLSSLGQLGWRDVILLGLTAIIIEVYVRFRWP